MEKLRKTVLPRHITENSGISTRFILSITLLFIFIHTEQSWSVQWRLEWLRVSGIKCWMWLEGVGVWWTTDWRTVARIRAWHSSPVLSHAVTGNKRMMSTCLVRVSRNNWLNKLNKLNKLIWIIIFECGWAWQTPQYCHRQRLSLSSSYIFT